MPIEITIWKTPKKDGETCAIFNPFWWRNGDLMRDPRFRVIDPDYFYSIGCLSVKEMRELQDLYRPRTTGLDHWETPSDRLDKELQGAENEGRWWVVSVYEWENWESWDFEFD